MTESAAKRLPAAERRRTILNAALQLLPEAGYAGMTTARVAQAAGISEPILYRHFASKREIIRTLLDEIITRMMGAFHKLVEGETDAAAALWRICRAYPELSRRFEREFRIINQTLVGTNDPQIQEMLAAHYEAYRGFLQRWIEKGRGDGTFRRDLPAGVCAWHIIHSALGYLMTQPIRKTGRSTKGFERLADATLAGILAPHENSN